MTKYARAVELFIGVFFLATAGAKALNMDNFALMIRAYNVVTEPGLVRLAAYATLMVETLLAALFISGARFRGLVHAAAALLTAVFSGLIGYAAVVHGLEECGCIPGIAMGPIPSLIKNLVLIGALVFAWYGTRPIETGEVESSTKTHALPRVAGGAAIFLVATIWAYGTLTASDSGTVVASGEITDADRPFQQFTLSIGGEAVNLGEGEYLVALLNATCEHCIASMPALNALALSDELPEMVGLMLGSDDELDDFIISTEPAFSTHLIDQFAFMDLIGMAPPRLYYVRDGAGAAFWDWEDAAPGLEAVSTRIREGG